MQLLMKRILSTFSIATFLLFSMNTWAMSSTACWVEITKQEAATHTGGTSLSGTIRLGPNDGQKVTLQLPANKSLSDLAIGDMVKTHNDEHKVMGIAKLKNGDYLLSLLSGKYVKGSMIVGEK